MLLSMGWCNWQINWPLLILGSYGVLDIFTPALVSFQQNSLKRLEKYYEKGKMTKVMPYSLDKIMYGKGIVHREVIFMLFNANIQCFNTSTFVQLLPTLY